MSGAREEAGLPAWLCDRRPPEPVSDRDHYLRDNVLRLMQTLTVFRAEPPEDAGIDAALAHVASPVRLLGLVTVVLLVSLARNMAFVWVALALALALLAARPAPVVARVLPPALAACALAALVNLPAALALGQTTSVVRVATKTFVTLSLTGLLARTRTPESLLEGLALLGLPAGAVLTIDLAVRDLALIGQEALSLSEALELRSVGRNRDKTAGVVGVLGVCLLSAMRHAHAQAEAMALRGYDGSAPAAARQARLTGANACYLALVAVLVLSFCYLEHAL